MKHPLSTVGLLSAALLATAAPVLAAPAGPDRPPMASDGPRHGGCGDRHGPGRFGPPGEPRDDDRRGPESRLDPALELAARLSAAETYVGVTPAQEDAWRAYTSALIAFFDHPQPPPGIGPDDANGPQDDAQPPSPPKPGPVADAPTSLPSDRIADRAIERGEKAKALKAATDALRSALKPDQLQRLAKAEEVLRPPRPPHRMDEPRPGPDMRPGPDGGGGPGPMPRDMPPPPPPQE